MLEKRPCYVIHRDLPDGLRALTGVGVAEPLARPSGKSLLYDVIERDAFRATEAPEIQFSQLSSTAADQASG